MRRLVSLVLSAVAAAVLSSAAAHRRKLSKSGVVLSLSGPAAVFGIQSATPSRCNGQVEGGRASSSSR